MKEILIEEMRLIYGGMKLDGLIHLLLYLMHGERIRECILTLKANVWLQERALRPWIWMEEECLCSRKRGLNLLNGTS